MSRLIVLTRSALVTGFRLAGVDAYGAEDFESAEALVERWLDEGEVGLLAIDEGLLAGMNPALVRRLQAAETLPHLAIPGGELSEAATSRRHRIATIVRRAIGFQITFKGEDAGGGTP
jgi:V/A-type H+-transporting ATPase subunit F